jgi:hypothetical protein
MEILNRPVYTDRIRPFIGKGIIKVLIGQRRVGKSSLLLQLMKDIKKEHPKANIIYVNRELESFHFIKDDKDLFALLREKILKGRHNYLFVDEVQDITGFENVFRSLLSTEACDIFCTGSNANLLSGELATYLSGRTIEFTIHSLSYSEFLYFHGLIDSDDTLRLFLKYGGMPHLSRLTLDDETAFEYLRNVYSTILLKDVVKREGIRNIDFLETLVSYLADNVGNLFSATNISKFLKSQRVGMSPMVIINYLKALSNAFIINKITRIDIHGLKKFEIGEKYFFEDLGLRNCIGNFNIGNDIHKLIENAVYQHLKFLQFDVYVGKYDAFEIDFVGIRREKKVYVQVSFLITDEKTRQREYDQLLKISDNFPKYLVSMDPIIMGDVQGIHHTHLRTFLMKTEL